MSRPQLRMLLGGAHRPTCNAEDWQSSVTYTKRVRAWMTTRRRASVDRIVQRAFDKHDRELRARGWLLFPQSEVTTIYLGLFLTSRCFRNGQVLTVFDLDEQE